MQKLCFKKFHVSLGTKKSCICPRKSQRFASLFHWIWSRWFNFLLLLQCSICSLYRKNNDKKSNYLPTITYLLQFFLASNTHTNIHIYIYIYIYIYIHTIFTFILVSAIKFEVTRSSLKMFGVSTPLQTMHPSPVKFIGELRYLKNDRGQRMKIFL